MQLHQQHISPSTSFAIWQIEEPLDFFLAQIPFDEQYLSGIHHPTKKLEFAASRYLAAQLTGTPSDALILKNEDRSPFFKNLEMNVSFSHTHLMVAAMVSSNQKVGIDIEKMDERIFRIQPRFLNDAEIPNHLLEIELHKIARCWSVKEAVFKCLREHNIFFKEELVIAKWENETAIVNIKTKLTQQPVAVVTAIFGEYVYAYCVM